MDILIIGSGNEEFVGKIKELASIEENISVSVVEDCTISSIKVGSPEIESRRGKNGIKKIIEQNIILAGDRKSAFDDFLQPSKNKIALVSSPGCAFENNIFKTYAENEFASIKNIQEFISIKAAKEPNLFDFSGYEHMFGKILHIKRQLDFDNTKCLSSISCNQNKSLLKQHNIKQQPIICRRHGVDNRR